MLQGDTRNLPLTGLFQTLEMGQEDGVLTVYFQRMERYFLIRNRSVSLIGERAGSSPNLQGILAGLRILKRQEYDNVLSTISSPCAPGDALLQCKLITPEQVLGPVREQILESIYEIFEWRGARYRFEVTKIPPERLLFSDPEIARSMDFPIQSVLMEVARREDEWSRIRSAIPHAHQIYRLNDPEALAGFTTPEIPDETRMQHLLRLFDGEHPLTSVLNDSAVPAFYVFSILRTLLERDLAGPIALSEKKELAERLRNRRQTSRMAEIYRSILEEDAEDDEMRRRLVFILEKKKENTRELVEHYHHLAEGAKRRGDVGGQHVLLRRQLEMAPKDLSIHERALAEFALTGNSRDIGKLLHGYVEQAMKLGQEGRAADFLFEYSEQVEEKSPIYEKTGDLLGRQGQATRAADAYENAMRTVADDARVATVRRVAEKLRRFDGRTADKWLKRIGAERKGSTKKRFPVVRVAAILLVCGLAFAGIHEYRAFTDRTLVIANAERALKIGEVDSARAEFDAFREKYPISIATLDLDRVWSEMRAVERTIVKDFEGNPVVPDEIPRNEEEFEFERFLSEATDLKRSGQYDAALAHFDSVSEDRFPGPVRATVREEVRQLRKYLERAGALLERARRVESEGDLERAGTIYQELVTDFPHSRAAKGARLPLLLDVLPPHATLIVDGTRIEPPFEVRVSGENLIDLRAEAPGFEPFQQILDPRRNLAVTAHLQRIPSWIQATKAQVDARPVVIGETVIVGDRNGTVSGRNVRDGSVLWTFPIDGIGDVVGGFLPHGDSIVFASTDGAVYRVRIADGKKVFRLPLPDGGLPRGGCSEIGDGRFVAVATSSGRAHWIDIETGKAVWQQRLPFDPRHAPALAGNRLIIGNDAGNVICLATADGKTIWERRFEVGFATAAAANAELWVVGLRDHRVLAIDARSGNVAWDLPLPAEPVDQIGIGSGHVCATTRDGGIHVALTEDGSLVWSSIGHGEFRRAPHLVDNRVITIDGRGELLVHRLGDGAPLWSYGCGSKSGSPIGGDAMRIAVVDAEPKLHLVPLGNGGEETSAVVPVGTRDEGRFAAR